MAQNRLNLNSVKALKPKERLYNESDGGGLYLRVLPSGAKRWYFVFVSAETKKQRWMDLGSFPDVPLYDDAKPELGARGKATAARLLHAQGKDPINEAERALTKQEVDAKIVTARLALEAERPQTVEQLFSKWREAELVLRKDDKGEKISGRQDSGIEVERTFRKDVFPEIGKHHPLEVEQRHIMRIRDEAAKRGVKRTLNVLLANMRQMFEWGRLRKFAVNPTEGIKKPSFGGRETPRERWLHDGEISELAAKLHVKKNGRFVVPRKTQLALLLQLATACRMGELSLSAWKNVDFDKSTLHLPKDIRKDTSDTQDHDVFLSSFAIRVLQELKRFTGETEYLFPNRDSDGPIDEDTFGKEVHDRQTSEPIKGRTKNCDVLRLSDRHWRPHDLRRTAATIINKLALQQQFSAVDSKTLSERCLSHLEPDKLHRTYNNYTFDEEMKKCWIALGAHLDKIIPAYVLEPAPIKPKKITPAWKHDEMKKALLGN